VKKVQDSGSVEFRGIKFGIGRSYAGHRVCVMDAGKVVMIFDLTGTLIIEHPWPKPGTTYVSNRQPRGPAAFCPDFQRCPDTSTVRDVLIQKRQRCPDTSQVQKSLAVLSLPTSRLPLRGSGVDSLIMRFVRHRRSHPTSLLSVPSYINVGDDLKGSPA